MWELGACWEHGLQKSGTCTLATLRDGASRIGLVPKVEITPPPAPAGRSQLAVDPLPYVVRTKSGALAPFKLIRITEVCIVMVVADDDCESGGQNKQCGHADMHRMKDEVRGTINNRQETPVPATDTWGSYREDKFLISTIIIMIASCLL